MSNSLAATKRVIDAVAGREPRLADEPDFRYMLARDAATPGRRARVPQRPVRGRGDRPAPEGAGGAPADRARRAVASRVRGVALRLDVRTRPRPAPTRSSPPGLLKRDELAHAGRRAHRLAAGPRGAVVVGRGRRADAAHRSARAREGDVVGEGGLRHLRHRLPELLAHQHRSGRDPDWRCRPTAAARCRRTCACCRSSAAPTTRTCCAPSGRARVDLGGRHRRPPHGDRHRRRRRDPAPADALAARDADGRLLEGGLAGRLGAGGHRRHGDAGVARGDARRKRRRACPIDRCAISSTCRCTRASRCAT